MMAPLPPFWSNTFVLNRAHLITSARYVVSPEQSLPAIRCVVCAVRCAVVPDSVGVGGLSISP